MQSPLNRNTQGYKRYFSLAFHCARALGLTLSYTIIPPRCLICNIALDQQQRLCHSCFEILPTITEPCAQCGKNMSPTRANLITHCSDCQNHKFSFTKCISGLSYTPMVAKVTVQFKYRGDMVWGKILFDQLAWQLQRHYNSSQHPLPQLILPVPLHWSRLQRRGFNQSVEIARYLAKVMSVPYTPLILYCRRAIPQLAGRSAKQRQQIVKNNFGIRRPHLLSQKGIKRVALVDDVVTTTSTVNAISKILKKAGVEEIHVWSLARA